MLTTAPFTMDIASKGTAFWLLNQTFGLPSRFDLPIGQGHRTKSPDWPCHLCEASKMHRVQRILRAPIIEGSGKAGLPGPPEAEG